MFRSLCLHSMMGANLYGFTTPNKTKEMCEKCLYAYLRRVSIYFINYCLPKTSKKNKNLFLRLNRIELFFCFCGNFQSDIASEKGTEINGGYIGICFPIRIVKFNWQRLYSSSRHISIRSHKQM